MGTMEEIPFWEDISSDCLLTDDIWDKFQLSSLDFNDFDWIRGDFEDTKVEIESRSQDSKSDIEIRNHDCMWAGHCGSKEHSMDDFKNILVKPISYIFQPTPVVAPVQNLQAPTIPAPVKQSLIAPGRSLLLKTQPQHQQQLYLQQQQMQQQQAQQQQQEVITPTASMEVQTTTSVDSVNAATTPHFESPPNSDDEDTQVLQYLQDYISECDLDDDDLVDYFKHFEGDIEETKPDVKTVVQEPPKAVKHFDRSAKLSRFVNDHCYHKDKNASMMRMPETPSDSEEEIDVVSTDDKHTNPQRTVGALPTNPTTRDRAHIQKTMATAITKNGIRTLVPRKTIPTAGSSDSQEDSPSKRRPDGRGMKRARHHHHRLPPSPYKKQRATAFQQPSQHALSSDSEQEPSEKRIEHNNMERQRRVDLRNAFEELRVLVPEVNKRERAPKVVILREAAVYCHKLTDVSAGMRRQVDEMRRQQKRLRMRLSQLRLSLAPSHR